MLCICVLAACSSGIGAPRAPKDLGADAAYRLGPGDKVEVTVFGFPDLTGEFDVGSDGVISLPLTGDIQAAGKTVSELRGDIVTTLASEFIVDPRVSLEVSNFRPFFILGEVESPGQYPFVSGLDVRQSIALAGGFTRRANEHVVELVRVDATGDKVDYTADLDTPILPGDTITVVRRLF